MPCRVATGRFALRSSLQYRCSPCSGPLKLGRATAVDGPVRRDRAFPHVRSERPDGGTVDLPRAPAAPQHITVADHAVERVDYGAVFAAVGGSPELLGQREGGEASGGSPEQLDDSGPSVIRHAPTMPGNLDGQHPTGSRRCRSRGYAAVPCAGLSGRWSAIDGGCLSSPASLRLERQDTHPGRGKR